MELIRTTVTIGLAEPVRVLHFSDTHLTRADLRDGERKVKLADARFECFKNAEEVLQFAAANAMALELPILHTGDLCDFVSQANIEAARAFTDEYDVFMVAGNHEFSLYVGEAWEDEAYRNQSLAAVQSAHKNNIRMDSRIIGGVNFVALDNGYYLFDREQLEFLKAQAALGLPIVLMCHVPLYDPALYDFELKRVPGCAYLCGVPEEKMAHYDEYRFRQQRADAVTLETLDYVAREPLVKAILTGHLHINHEASYAGRMPQIFTGNQALRLIEFV
ncbi:MAG: metallophosphoesterase [Ruminococcaceae bacterium]|nr:metallophosphoesterase [Oscillospiraceae bacterium]